MSPKRIPMRHEIAIAQATGMRRAADDLARAWSIDIGLQAPGLFTSDEDAAKEKFPGEKFLGNMLAAPVLHALAAELALKAIAIKTSGTHKDTALN